MNPNDIQPGGDHYKRAGDLQHWDMLPALGFGWEYYLGAATKYLTRVKDTVLDPQKARHFLDKLLHLIDNGKVPDVFQSCQGMRNSDGGTRPHHQRVDVEDYLRDYFAANGIDPKSNEASAILFLMIARTRDDLLAAREAIQRIIDAKTPAKTAELKVKPEVAAQVDTPYESASITGNVDNGLVTGTGINPTGTGEATAAYTNQDGPAATPAPTPRPRRGKGG